MKRERSSGLYRTSSFYVAEVLVEIPAQIAQRVLFYVILYWMIGLKPTGAAFFIFLGVNFMQVLTAIGIGLLIGSLSPNIDIANILAPLFNVIMLLFGGNLLPSPPPWFVWLRWISPITYAYAALSINEFSGAVYECDDSSGGMQSQCYRSVSDTDRVPSLATTLMRRRSPGRSNPAAVQHAKIHHWTEHALPARHCRCLDRGWLRRSPLPRPPALPLPVRRAIPPSCTT